MIKKRGLFKKIVFGIALACFPGLAAYATFSKNSSPTLNRQMLLSLEDDELLVFSGSDLVLPENDGSTYKIDFRKTVTIIPIVKDQPTRTVWEVAYLFKATRVFRKPIKSSSKVGIKKLVREVGSVPAVFVSTVLKTIDGKQYDFETFQSLISDLNAVEDIRVTTKFDHDLGEQYNGGNILDYRERFWFEPAEVEDQRTYRTLTVLKSWLPKSDQEGYAAPLSFELDWDQFKSWGEPERTLLTVIRLSKADRKTDIQLVSINE